MGSPSKVTVLIRGRDRGRVGLPSKVRPLYSYGKIPYHSDQDHMHSTQKCTGDAHIADCMPYMSAYICSTCTSTQLVHPCSSPEAAPASEKGGSV